MKRAIHLVFLFCWGVAASFLLGLAALHFHFSLIAVAVALGLLAISVTPAGHSVWCRWFPTESAAIAARLLVVVAMLTGLGLALIHGGRA